MKTDDTGGPKEVIDLTRTPPSSTGSRVTIVDLTSSTRTGGHPFAAPPDNQERADANSPAVFPRITLPTVRSAFESAINTGTAFGSSRSNSELSSNVDHRASTPLVSYIDTCLPILSSSPVTEQGQEFHLEGVRSEDEQGSIERPLSTSSAAAVVNVSVARDEPAQLPVTTTPFPTASATRVDERHRVQRTAAAAPVTVNNIHMGTVITVAPPPVRLLTQEL